jgi:ubiquinone biosynthesis protein
LAGETADGLTLDTAVTDFRHAVCDRADLRQQARAWAAAAEDAAADDGLYVPRVYAELSTPRVLTREWVPGRRLEDVTSSPAADGAGRPDLASRLCAAWLRSVLLGRFFPGDPGGNDVRVLPDGRVAFTGGYVAVPASARVALGDYLGAAAAGDPDAACAHLFRLMDGGLPVAREDEVRRRFRQAVSAGRTGAEGGGDALGEVLLGHWRLALAQGCRPPAYLARLFRAAFLLQAAAARLDPARDALRDGLADVRMAAAFDQVGDLMSLGQMARALGRYAPALSDLPRRLDEALTVLAEGSARVGVRLRETAEGRETKNAAAATGGLALAVAAVALVLHHLTRVGAVGDWGASAAGALVLVAGAWLLGRVTGGR